jgi:hypothetical protein
MCILLGETLQVPNLVQLCAFRGGSLQIRDSNALTQAIGFRRLENPPASIVSA